MHIDAKGYEQANRSMYQQRALISWQVNKIKENNFFMISNSNLDCILNTQKIFKLNKSIANTNNILHESIAISAKVKVTCQYEEGREDKKSSPCGS
jgi:hypothetical protein